MLKVRNGDRDAFRMLYERYKRPIMSYVAQMIQDAGAAEELSQEVFLRAYRARESYEPDAKVSTWLWQIARNAAIDHLRKKKELSADSWSYAGDNGEETFSLIDETPSPDPSAEAQLIERSDRSSVEDCLAKLSFQQREALNLRINGELSYEEIAETLETKVPAVKSLIHRAKLSLTRCLELKERKGGARS